MSALRDLASDLERTWGDRMVPAWLVVQALRDRAEKLEAAS